MINAVTALNFLMTETQSRASYSEATAENERLRAQLADAQAQVHQLQAALNEALDEKEHLQAQLAEAQATIARLEEGWTDFGRLRIGYVLDTKKT